MVKDDQKTKSKSVSAKPEISTSFKRSHLLYKIFAGVVLIEFAIILSVSIYQLDFWQLYFFSDSVNLGKTCELTVQFSDKKDWPTNEEWASLKSNPIVVPHLAKDKLAYEYSEASLAYRHFRYVCRPQIDSKSISAGNKLIHFGWIFAETTEILVNGKVAVSLKGNDKPIVPVADDQVQSSNFEIEIRCSAPEKARLGMRGAAPVVLSAGVNQNSKVMGVEVSLQLIRPLIQVMPALTLCLILIVAWKLGVTSRILLTAIYYFALVTTRHLFFYLVDFWPWTIATTYILGSALVFGARLGFLAFCLEFFKIGIRWLELWKIMFIVLTLAFLVLNSVTIYFGFSQTLYFSLSWIAEYSLPVLTLLCSIYGYFKGRLDRDATREESLLRLTLLFLVGLLAIGQYADYLLLNSGYNIKLTNQLDFMAPFFVAAILFYQLSLIQRHYEIEKTARLRMQSDLSVAREIQDSLAPPPPQSVFGSYVISCYQKKHDQVAGDWMAVRRSGQSSAIVVIADVTGKGMQAALVVHAIQSLWADALSEATLDIERWIQKLNLTLCRLGEKKPHSTTLAILHLEEDRFTYYSQGHTPCFYRHLNSEIEGGGKVRVLQGRGSILGLDTKIEIQKAEAIVSKTEKIEMFIATDGVLQNGTRTKPREAVEIFEMISTNKDTALNGFDQNDDKTLILVSHQ